MTPDQPPAQPAIADYELLRLVGRGSYGDVWLARGVTGVFRAVKIVWRQRFADAQPFEREFRGLKEFAAVSLTETRQLALLHVGRNDAAGFFYYVMELADDATRGREIDPADYVPNSLREVRARRGRLPAAEVVAIGTELARGLAGLHTRGLVHRDIKPSNVIIVGGQPKLADIGLVANASAALTFVGTEGYVPPEGPGAPAADVFSLGKLLYELATGLDRHDYPRLPPDFQALPDRKELLELNEVLIRACEPDATKRHRDATALLDDLLLLQAGKSVRRLRAAERRLARALRVAAMLALIAGVAGTGAFIERRRAVAETQLRRGAEAERDALADQARYAAALTRAQHALGADDFGRARQHLESVLDAPELARLRGFEWQALMHEARGDAATILQAGGAQRLFLSPDGTRAAVLGSDQSARIVEASSFATLASVTGVFGLAGFSSDGRWLVGVDTKARLQRWSAETGAPAGAIGTGLNRPVAPVGDDCALAFREGGGTAAGHTLRLWDFARGADVATFALEPAPAGPPWDFYRAAASSDGRTLALALIRGRSSQARWKLQLRSLPDGRVLHEEETPHRLTALAFAPQQPILAVAEGDTAEIGLLDFSTARWRWRRSFGQSQPNSLAFSPHGTLLAIGARGSLVRTVELRDPDRQVLHRGHAGAVDSLAWLPGSLSLLSAGGDVRRWSEAALAPPSVLSGLWKPSGGGRHLCLAPDGTALAATDTPEAGALVAALDRPAELGRIPGRWLPLALYADATASGLRADGTWERWRVRDQRAELVDRFALLTPPAAPIAVASLTRDATRLAAGLIDGRVICWDLAQRRPVADFAAHQGNVVFTVLSPDGDRLATCGSDKTQVSLWDPATARCLARIAGASAPQSAAFSPDGATLAIGWADGQLSLIQAATGRSLRRWPTGLTQLSALAFSPDGRRLACGGANCEVLLLDAADWREVAMLRSPSEATHSGDRAVASLAFSAEGNVLAGYLNDGRVRLWRR